MRFITVLYRSPTSSNHSLTPTSTLLDQSYTESVLPTPSSTPSSLTHSLCIPTPSPSPSPLSIYCLDDGKWNITPACVIATGGSCRTNNSLKGKHSVAICGYIDAMITVIYNNMYISLIVQLTAFVSLMLLGKMKSAALIFWLRHCNR